MESMLQPSPTPGALYDDFFYPPFSVLDSKAGWWRDRKRRWLAEGLQSELGRAKVWSGMDTAHAIQAGLDKVETPSWVSTSIFDPVLAEILYRWFAPPGGLVFDPFAGGIVRGLVASRLGLSYTGFEIRQEQIDENKRQLSQLSRPGDPSPVWKRKDACARSIQTTIRTRPDMIMTCPPYGDLEVYSDNPADISTMPWDTFAGALTHSIKQAALRLKDNRFAVYVVSDVRAPDGSYRGLPDTVRAAATAAGLSNYAELVLLNNLGTAPIRARGQFEKTRKVCRVHQLALVFLKGDAAKARSDIGPVRDSCPFLPSIDVSETVQAPIESMGDLFGFG